MVVPAGFWLTGPVVLNVTGGKSKSITINGTDVSKAKKGVEVSYGVKEDAVKMLK